MWIEIFLAIIAAVAFLAFLPIIIVIVFYAVLIGGLFAVCATAGFFIGAELFPTIQPLWFALIGGVAPFALMAIHRIIDSDQPQHLQEQRSRQ